MTMWNPDLGVARSWQAITCWVSEPCLDCWHGAGSSLRCPDQASVVSHSLGHRALPPRRRGYDHVEPRPGGGQILAGNHVLGVRTMPGLLAWCREQPEVPRPSICGQPQSGPPCAAAASTWV